MLRFISYTHVFYYRHKKADYIRLLLFQPVLYSIYNIIIPFSHYLKNLVYSFERIGKS